MNTANLFSCFGDIIELDFERWNVERTEDILRNHPEWKVYNPRKKNNRYGLSVTSLDGQYSGIPDLDSVLEYNLENGTKIVERDFCNRTPLASEIPELTALLDVFDKGLGRCHFLRLDSGGFFPPHRDNGGNIPSFNFRIIVPLLNVGRTDWKWLQEDRVTYFEPGKTYCVNTTKAHSVFSFVDGCTMLVLNVTAYPAVIQQITARLAIR
jgi:hypothetical protein